MSADDLEYYRQRAKDERERAELSSRSDIAEIHEELARLYEALIEYEQLCPTLSLKFPTNARLSPSDAASNQGA